METRVALTDADSLRRFRRYWVVIGPFSGLIRQMALRLLAADLRPFPDRAASLLPGLLAATRTGLPPAGDDEGGGGKH